MLQMPASPSPISLSNLRTVYGGTNPIKLSNCLPSTTSLIRTQDITPHLPGTVCALSLNGTDAESIGGFVTGNAANLRYNKGLVSTMPYAPGLTLPKGIYALDLSTNNYVDSAVANVYCRYEIPQTFDPKVNGATITCWFHGLGKPPQQRSSLIACLGNAAIQYLYLKCYIDTSTTYVVSAEVYPTVAVSKTRVFANAWQFL